MALNPGGMIGFNIVFDVFHLCKAYTTFLLFAEKHGYDQYPEDFIEEIAVLEEKARDGPCWKPVTACDLMLVARKGPYQALMDRGDIRIRKVPTALAFRLAVELEKRVPLKDIYFARRANKRDPHWKVLDIRDEDDEVIPDFKDVVLSFAPSSALKALVCDALGVQPDTVLLFNDVNVDKVFSPAEYGWAPFATAVGSPGHWNGAWPAVIGRHINHWAHYELARKYAAKDVEYLPRLYDFFGRPALGDDDSTLACSVAAVRWHGFKVDVEGLKELRTKARVLAARTPTAPNTARKYIEQLLDPTEMLALRDKGTGKSSTRKVVLEALAQRPEWAEIPCPACSATGEVTFGDYKEPAFTPPAVDGEINADVDYDAAELRDDAPVATLVAPMKGVCEVCDGKKTVRHPASQRAQEVLDARMAEKEIELYDKLIQAGRFHASFKIIGTLSSRMAGADKLNPQGVKKTKEVRKRFPLAFDGYRLCGGDFKSFEVVLADAVYGDPDLRADLQSKVTCPDCAGSGVKKGKPCKDCEGAGQAGRSIHAISSTPG
jgi:hypothetical protein